MTDPSGDTARDRIVAVGLVAVTSISAAVFLMRGAGFVLDDWFTLRNAQFDGVIGAAGAAQGRARPGSVGIFALVFGIFGRHPLPGVVLLAGLNSATAVVTFRLVRRFVAWGPAALTALLWAVLPTHTATEMWVTCAILAVSQLALTAALLISVRDDLSRAEIAVSCALLSISVLAYEASLPMAAAGALVLPLLVHRRIDLRFLVPAAVACAAPALWVLTHWYSGKSLHRTLEPTRLLQVNLGWGLTPDGPGSPLALPLVLVALGGCAVAVASVVRSTQHGADGERMVVAGLVVMVVGVLPFVRYFYEPQGAGDRANYLSSVGGALVWAGLVTMLARLDRRVAAMAIAALIALAVPARSERITVWSTAGLDAQAIADAIVVQIPAPRGTVVVGPAPIVRWNVAAYVDDSNLAGALSIAYGVPYADVRLARSPEDWAQTPADLRFDLRTVSDLDDLSVL